MIFSMSRLWAIIKKEFILMKRDPAVIVIMAILPLVLVCITGYAVNTFPKNVPTVLMDLDNSPTTREFVQGMKNTGYFTFVAQTSDIEEAYRLVRKDEAIFILTIPPRFTQSFLRHEKPAVLLEDGSLDALSTGRAIISMIGLQHAYLQNIHTGSLANLQQPASSFRTIVNRLYDPDHITQFFLVPGMIGLILMLTMLMITTVIAFRDIQGGTIEYLLASPTHPSEILIGEILSYIIIGYIQLALGVLLAFYVFHVPFLGNPGLLAISAFPYIVAELSLGLTIATFCNSQFEAVQVVNLFISLSIVLTGFVFPIFAMPEWAKYLSHIIPLTYFFKILFGVMLKGNDFSEIWPNLWPLILFSLIMISLAVLRFRRHFR